MTAKQETDSSLSGAGNGDEHLKVEPGVIANLVSEPSLPRAKRLLRGAGLFAMGAVLGGGAGDAANIDYVFQERDPSAAFEISPNYVNDLLSSLSEDREVALTRNLQISDHLRAVLPYFDTPVDGDISIAQSFVELALLQRLKEDEGNSLRGPIEYVNPTLLFGIGHIDRTDKDIPLLQDFNQAQLELIASQDTARHMGVVSFAVPSEEIRITVFAFFTDLKDISIDSE